jgi:hypothetical protein
MSFGLSEEELTWDVVRKLKKDDSYSLVVKRQPMAEMQGAVGSTFFAVGRPYRVIVWYFLKGYELLVGQLRCDSGLKDFESQLLVDLSTCSLMTETVLMKAKTPFWCLNERAKVAGERFFLAKGYDTPPYLPAFFLEYPDEGDRYKMQDAVRFSQKIKSRIHQRLVERVADEVA